MSSEMRPTNISFSPAYLSELTMLGEEIDFIMVGCVEGEADVTFCGKVSLGGFMSDPSEID